MPMSGVCRCGGMACTVCFLSSALLAACLAAYVASELAKFTPTWEPVKCVDLENPPVQQSFDAPNWINMTEEGNVECGNPNPYAIHIEFYQQGDVFVNWTEPNSTNSFLIPVGWSDHTNVVFPAEGSGVQTTWTHGSMPWGEAMTIIGAGPSQIVHKTYVKSSMVITLYGMEIEAGNEKHEVWCGYTYDFASADSGDELCESTLEDLVVPGMDYVAPPKVVDLEDKDKDKLENVKFIAIIMPLNFFLVVFCFCCIGGILSLLKGRREARVVTKKEVEQSSVI